jgi:hypothetical protein
MVADELAVVSMATGPSCLQQGRESAQRQRPGHGSAEPGRSPRSRKSVALRFGPTASHDTSKLRKQTTRRDEHLAVSDVENERLDLREGRGVSD